MKLPVVFMGHGSPMNVIEDNEFTRSWRKLANELPRPKAILSISGHWFTNGTRVMTSETPKTVYDLYGFPKGVQDAKYPVSGAPTFALKTLELLADIVPIAEVDNTWGIDHGTWSILKVMYPDADIPVYQLSVDRQASPDKHYAIGQLLKPLREEGVLIFGSGNVVHNLGQCDFSMPGGHEFAEAFDTAIYEFVISRNYEGVLTYKSLGSLAKLSVPSSDHFDPLLYVLGASDSTDTLEVLNRKCVLGGLSMTSYVFR